MRSHIYSSIYVLLLIWSQSADCEDKSEKFPDFCKYLCTPCGGTHTWQNDICYCRLPQDIGNSDCIEHSKKKSHSLGIHLTVLDGSNRIARTARPIKGTFLDPVVANVFERQETSNLHNRLEKKTDQEKPLSFRADDDSKVLNDLENTFPSSVDDFGHHIVPRTTWWMRNKRRLQPRTAREKRERSDKSVNNSRSKRSLHKTDLMIPQVSKDEQLRTNQITKDLQFYLDGEKHGDNDSSVREKVQVLLDHILVRNTSQFSGDSSESTPRSDSGETGHHHVQVRSLINSAPRHPRDIERTPRNPRGIEKLNDRTPRNPRGIEKLNERTPRNPRGIEKLNERTPRNPRGIEKLNERTPRNPRGIEKLNDRTPRNPRGIEKLVDRTPRNPRDVEALNNLVGARERNPRDVNVQSYFIDRKARNPREINRMDSFVERIPRHPRDVNTAKISDSAAKFKRKTDIPARIKRNPENGSEDVTINEQAEVKEEAVPPEQVIESEDKEDVTKEETMEDFPNMEEELIQTTEMAESTIENSDGLQVVSTTESGRRKSQRKTHQKHKIEQGDEDKLAQIMARRQNFLRRHRKEEENGDSKNHIRKKVFKGKVSKNDKKEETEVEVNNSSGEMKKVDSIDEGVENEEMRHEKEVSNPRHKRSILEHLNSLVPQGYQLISFTGENPSRVPRCSRGGSGSQRSNDEESGGEDEGVQETRDENEIMKRHLTDTNSRRKRLMQEETKNNDPLRITFKDLKSMVRKPSHLSERIQKLMTSYHDRRAAYHNRHSSCSSEEDNALLDSLADSEESDEEKGPQFIIETNSGEK